MKPSTSARPSFLFPVAGNVYPLGYFTARIVIGNPPKLYVLDIDTGSDLTWVTCVGADPTPINPYTPRIEDAITCQDPDCAAVGADVRLRDGCTSPSNDQCQYMVSYFDGGSSTGNLVRGLFALRSRNSKWITPRLIFGCGTRNYGQIIGDGILGLGKGNSGILKQLREMGVIRNVVGHCFSAQGGGYLFIGDVPVLAAWKQTVSSDAHYNLGSADILLDGQATDIKGLEITFDSGSTYTYLVPLAYEALLDLVKRNLNGTPLTVTHDINLPMCWGASTPITSFGDVSGYFKPLALNFTGEQNVPLTFEMHLESYLIITDEGNVCLGILDVGEVGGDQNIIGDISMHDKVVIYDNDNKRVGWAPANCTGSF